MLLSMGSSILSLLSLTSNANQSNKYKGMTRVVISFMEYGVAGLNP
jgi:hypothetical protein